jgi:hypothetical protein
VSGCEGPSGEPADSAATYDKVIELRSEADARRLIDATRTYWSERGYHPRDENPNSQNPVVRASFDGYILALDVLPQQRKALLGGTTPCLPSGQAR